MVIVHDTITLYKVILAKSTGCSVVKVLCRLVIHWRSCLERRQVYVGTSSAACCCLSWAADLAVTSQPDFAIGSRLLNT